MIFYNYEHKVSACNKEFIGPESSGTGFLVIYVPDMLEELKLKSS
jgi:hypothetical protein